MDERNKNENSDKNSQQPQNLEGQEDIKIWHRPQTRSGRTVRYVYEVQPESTANDRKTSGAASEGTQAGVQDRERNAAAAQNDRNDENSGGSGSSASQGTARNSDTTAQNDRSYGNAASQEFADDAGQRSRQSEDDAAFDSSAGRGSRGNRKQDQSQKSESGVAEKRKFMWKKTQKRAAKEKSQSGVNQESSSAQAVKGNLKNPLNKDNVSKSVRQEFWKQQMVEGTLGKYGFVQRTARKIREHFKQIVSVALVVILVFGGASFYNKNRRYHSYDVEWQIAAAADGSSSYYAFQDVILHYSSDGVSCIDQNGKVMWNQTFDMDIPTLAVRGDYIVIYDVKGTSLYIFNRDGCTGNAKTAKKILKADISNAGVTAVVLDDKTSNYINYFRKDGSVIEVEIKTLISGDGYPLDIAISPDGKQLISSYIYANSGVMMNRVVFRNFEVGKNKVDRTVGGFEQYKETLVPEVIFFDNQNSAAITEQSIDFYSTKNALEPELARTQEFDARIKTVLYNEEYVGVVLDSAENDKAKKAEDTKDKKDEKAQKVETAAADEGTAEAESEKNVEIAYTMMVFDKTGDRVMKQDINFEYEYADFSGDGIVVYNKNTLATYNLTGVCKYQDKLDRNIEGVLRFSENNLVVYANGALQKMTLR